MSNTNTQSGRHDNCQCSLTVSFSRQCPRPSSGVLNRQATRKCTHAMSSRTRAAINVGPFVRARAIAHTTAAELFTVNDRNDYMASTTIGAREIMNRQPLIRQTIGRRRCGSRCVMGVARHGQRVVIDNIDNIDNIRSPPSGLPTSTCGVLTPGPCAVERQREVPFILWPIVSLFVDVCA